MDMGARRYGLDTGRFLQQDMYSDALGDLGLSLDPMTQNRYALAGGNPISNTEVDGHINAEDGGGGATTSGGTTTTSTSTETTSETTGGTSENNDGGALSKVGNWFKSGAEKVDSALDQLDAKTVENPDWKLHTLYEGWKKFEEKAEPLAGATDIYNCGTEGGASNCAWAAAAIIPGGKTLKGAKALESGAESGTKAVTGAGARDVIVDTNATFNKPGVLGALRAGERPVVTQTTRAELSNLAAGGRVKSPRFANELDTVADIMDVNLRINLRGQMAALKAGQRGLFGDGAIGATAIRSGSPVITSDKIFSTVLRQFGAEVRRP